MIANCTNILLPKLLHYKKSSTIRSQLYEICRRKCSCSTKRLIHIENIKLVKSNSAEYEQGIVVIPAYLAKGIEFDAVIIYDASKDVYSDESVRRLFYTACTRAMHELQLYSVGEVSPFILEADSESF
ncbi:ATP-binding domain-containing protein [Bacillus pacificus]